MNIVDYLELKGYQLVRSGARSFECPCPLHSETKSSFWIYPEDDSYHCFGCNAHGYLRNLIVQLEFGGSITPDNMNAFRDRMQGLGIVATTQVFIDNHRSPSTKETLTMNIIYRHYKEELALSSEAQNYLKGRAIYNYQSLPLGYCSNKGSGFKKLVKKLLDTFGPEWRHLAISSGFIRENGSERYKGRIIVFEIRQDNVVYYQGRLIYQDNTDTKYLNPGSFRKTVFGLNSLDSDLSPIVLVEGIFDALPFMELGLPVISLNGDNLTEMDKVVDRINSRPVVILTDTDEAGTKIASKTMDYLKQKRLSFFRVRPPSPFKDANEWIQHTNIDTVLSALRYDS